MNDLTCLLDTATRNLKILTKRLKEIKDDDRVKMYVEGRIDECSRQILEIETLIDINASQNIKALDESPSRALTSFEREEFLYKKHNNKLKEFQVEVSA